MAKGGILETLGTWLFCRVPCMDERPGLGRSRRNAVCLLADDQVGPAEYSRERSPTEPWGADSAGTSRVPVGARPQRRWGRARDVPTARADRQRQRAHVPGSRPPLLAPVHLARASARDLRSALPPATRRRRPRAAGEPVPRVSGGDGGRHGHAAGQCPPPPLPAPAGPEGLP